MIQPFREREFTDRVHAMKSIHGETEAEYDQYILDSTAFLHKHLGFSEFDQVLDIGCGLGGIANNLVHDVEHITCTDVNVQMLKLAMEELSEWRNIDFNLVEDDRNPLKTLINDGRKYDKIFAQSVFIHLDTKDILAYIRDIDLVLKEGGRVIFKYCTINHSPSTRPFIIESNTVDVNWEILDSRMSTEKSWETTGPIASTRTVILTK